MTEGRGLGQRQAPFRVRTRALKERITRTGVTVGWEN
jgi:hypothetical protein